MIFSSRSFLHKGCLFVTLLGALSGLSSARTAPVDSASGSTSVQNAAADSDSLAEAETLVDSDDGQPGIPHSQEGDDRLKKADSHLHNGRDFYFKGNLAGAHREFDAAVDVLLNAPESLSDHARIERHLEQICDLIYRFDVEKLGAGQTNGTEESFDQAPIDEVSHMTFPIDEAMAAKLKSELNRTPSAIPLELADPVLSFVHYFSTERGRAILLSGLRRSGRYRLLIQKVFAEEGVPDELIYLAQAESGFLPRAISHKQAVGMWQFIAGTGADYDLIRTTNFDERFDPEKATRAAAKYLKDLHARYGDWYLAMAAYNCGAGAVDRAVERTGYADYWELLKRHALPKETSSYVPIIVAITIMAKNPLDYGLENVDLDSPIEYDSIQVSAPTNLNLVADATLQPLSVIRELNPSLLKQVAPAGFLIHVPKGLSEATQASLEIVPAANRNAWRLHHVETGDTLTTVAKTYHLSANSIAAVNKDTTSLEKGNVLLIPAVWHEEPASVKVRRASYKSGRSQRQVASSTVKSSKSSVARRGTHISASRSIASRNARS
jgi:membrane-bound lytic murein transglycosylase D